MNIKKLNFIIDQIITKKIGEINIDSGMFVITDPIYIGTDPMDKFKDQNYKEGEYTLRGAQDIYMGNDNKIPDIDLQDISGKSILISTLGGDGTYEVYGIYDTDYEWPDIPKDIIIKVHESINKLKLIRRIDEIILKLIEKQLNLEQDDIIEENK